VQGITLESKGKRKMKKFRLNIIVGLMLAMVAIAAIAGSVYDRTTVTLVRATGVATYTNDYKYAALVLKRIWIENCYVAIDTVTVTRVTSGGTYTQAVGSITTAANAGSTASFTASYLANGDMLKFTSGNTTGSTAIVEFEVQQH
jgi:hypothetical protein